MSELVLIEILAVPAEQSRGRHNPRAVKRKMSNFPTKARAAPAPRQVFRYEEHIRVVAPPPPVPPARPAPPRRRPAAKRHPPRAAAKPRCPPGLEHVRAWQASGLSRTAYCDRHGLDPGRFHRWVALSRQTLHRKPRSPA